MEIFEPFAGWHHTKYIAMLLPTLERLLWQSALSEVIVTTTDSHRASPYFRDQLERYSGSIRFDTFSADYRNLSGNRVSRELLASLRRNQPDFVISTSANNGAFSAALRCLGPSQLHNRRVSSIGILHNGYIARPKGVPNCARDLVHRLSRRFAPWSEVGIVNPLLFDTVRSQGRWAPSNVRMLPDPVERRSSISKGEARASLGIPIDGHYIVQVGKTDPRKAVPELLRAFREVGVPRGMRLLFAGELHASHRALINECFAELVDGGSTVLIDRYLTPDEMHAANRAADVVAVTYYTDELSSNMLAATAASRPVIASNKGYTGMMIERFGVGWGCDIADPTSVAAALESSLAGAKDYTPTPQTHRLLEFHAPENFAASVLQALYRRMNVPGEIVKTWEWVLKADSASNERGVHGGHG